MLTIVRNPLTWLESSRAPHDCAYAPAGAHTYLWEAAPSAGHALPAGDDVPRRQAGAHVGATGARVHRCRQSPGTSLPAKYCTHKILYNVYTYLVTGYLAYMWSTPHIKCGLCDEQKGMFSWRSCISAHYCIDLHMLLVSIDHVHDCTCTFLKKKHDQL